MGRERLVLNPLKRAQSTKGGSMFVGGRFKLVLRKALSMEITILK